jgi:hypothetical protein
MSRVSPSPLGEGRGEGKPGRMTPSPTLPQGGGSERWRRFRESETPSPTLPQGGGSERWKRFREMDAQG